MSDFPYPVGSIQMVSFPSNTTLCKASYCASFRECSALPNFSKANSKAQWKWSIAAAIFFFHQTSRRHNQTGTRIWWFRFWILPERPFPVPLDKGNEGSGYEIVYLSKCWWFSLQVNCFLFYLFHRNAFSRRCPTTQGCEYSGTESFGSLTAITAVGDGILPSMVQSVQLQQPLMV